MSWLRAQPDRHPVPGATATEDAGPSPVRAEEAGDETRLRTICVVVFLAITAVMATMPAISYTALAIDLSEAQIGAIGSSIAVLSMMLAIPVGRWVDRIGSAKILSAGCGLLLVAEAVLIRAGSMIALMVAASILGLGFMFGAVGWQTFVANHGPVADRERRVALYNVIGGLGYALGPLLLAFLLGVLSLDVHWVYVCSMGLAIGALVTSLSLHRTDRLRAGARGVAQRNLRSAIGTVLRAPTLLHALIVGAIVTAGMDLLVIYLPVYAAANDLSSGLVGVLLAILSGAAILSKLLIGRMLRVVSRGQVLLWSLLVPIAGLLVVPFLDFVPALSVALFVIGFGLGVGPVLTLAWVAWEVGQEYRGVAFGVRQVAHRGTQFLIPTAAGGAASVLGVGAVFFVLAALLAVACAAMRSAARVAA